MVTSSTTVSMERIRRHGEICLRFLRSGSADADTIGSVIGELELILGVIDDYTTKIPQQVRSSSKAEEDSLGESGI